MKFHIIEQDFFRVQFEYRKAVGVMDEKKETFVSSYLLYLLAASSESASGQFHDVVRSKGLRVPEWRVLACLIDQDGLMTTKLASYAMCEQSRMSRILDQMQTKDLIRRHTGEGDKRRVAIHLTDKGRGLAMELVDLARNHEAKLLALLKETDANRLKPALQTLLAVLSRQGQDVSKSDVLAQNVHF